MQKLPLTILAVFAFALVFFLWSGCKDDCPPCGDAYKTIPQEMKDWALFEDGSWWVYRLAEDTTVFDTVRVSPNSKTFFRSNKWKCHDNNSLSTQCSETITYGLKHSNTKYFGNPFDSIKTVYDQINLYYPPGGGVFLSYNNGAAPGTPGVIFGISPIKLNEYYGSLSLVDTLGNLNFNGLVVKKAFYSKNNTLNPLAPKTFDKVFWGKNIGLLKIQITHANGETKNWELINYEVKQ